MSAFPPEINKSYWELQYALELLNLFNSYKLIASSEYGSNVTNPSFILNEKIEKGFDFGL